MAECSYARCVQERRAIKKELQRWTKNMVFVVGLERVAEELMGRRKWKQYQDVVLRSPLTVEVEDWEPQDKCCFCDGGTFLGPAPSPTSDSGSSTNSRSSFRETPPVTLSEGNSAAHNPSSSATMTTLESVTSMAASLAAVAALSVNSNHSTSVNSSSGTLPPGAGAMPFYPPSHHHGGLFPPWYLSPPPPHLTPGRGVLPSAMVDGLRLEAVPSSKQDTPVPPMVMSLPASASTEQPLDLSAKASCPVSGETNSGLCSRIPTPDQSLKVPILDNKHIYKAKPRMSTVAGRRTYTEEELQAALRDIQSGKLGTRRAAVIYGIPRSTLRNKVYKLAMERERDSHLVLSNNTPLTVIPGDKGLLSPVRAIKVEHDGKEEEEEEKELSGAEDEREVEKALRKPLLSMEDLVRFSVLEGSGYAAAESLRTLLQHGKFLEDRHRGQSGTDQEDGTSPPVFPGFPHSDIWHGLEHSTLGPIISQLLAASTGGHRDFSTGIGNKNTSGGIPTTGENSPTDATDFLSKFSSPLLPDLVRHMMADEEKLRKNRASAHHSDASFLLNGAHTDETFKSEGKSVRPVGLQSSVITRSETTKSEAEEPSDTDAAATSSGMATPPNVILKIPSFKPTSKNGVASGGGSGAQESPFPTLGTFPHHSSNRSPSAVQESSQQSTISNMAGAGARSNHSDSCSPPITSLVGKGIGVSLRDVIAKSISQKFQQGSDLSHLPLSQKLLLPPDGTDQPPYKRGRFTPPLGCNPPSVIKHNNNNNNHLDDRNTQKASPANKSSSGSTSGNTTGNSSGKGTRPKRGKYRNYDRDSLVEAVRAVQRGEMSVHRAGSYYGVPHSTLEYKVKERHLMRPRKREPKPQLEEKRKEECNTMRNTPADKLKMPPKPPKVPYTPSSPIPNAPNGLKIPPLFDPSISPLAYATPPPFPFWPPNPFHHSLTMPDFAHGGSTANRFSPSTEQFFASQMMQRLQEESSRIHSNTSPGVSAIQSPPLVSSSGTLGKSAREMAESLYDGTGANGSFLDGIIRSSLEMGLPQGAAPKEGNNGSSCEKITTPENMSNKALLDQLCRNSRLTPLPRPNLPAQDSSSSDNDSHKQSSVNAYGKTESDGSMSTVVDHLPSSNGSTEHDRINAGHTAEEEDVKSPRENTKEMLSEENDSKSFSKETNGLSNANDDPTDDVSACDSKTNLTRVGDIDAAKDLTQEEGSDDPVTQEDTKSKKINS